jgi:hypothetical protein
MFTLRRFVVVSFAAVSFAGCGGEKSPIATDVAPITPSAQQATAAPSTLVQPSGESTPVALSVSPDSSPSEVVLAFLNAMRDGNSSVASELLSDLARAETAKHQWPVQPPGAPSATYKLGQPTYVDQNQTGVHVPCLWTEPDGAGGTIQFEVVWALRRLEQGWRVAGFATEIVPGKAPFFFNFEDIANLKETQTLAEAALVEAANAAEPNTPSVAERPAGNSVTR